VSHRFTVVSGFALGADTIGHKAALEAKGTTIAVMPCGLDLSFPPENRSLWNELLAYDRAVFVSEFPFGRRAASLTLRKRNRLIVAFARGVLVSQSARDGGAMNAYRFALEQKKPVATFVSDEQSDTTGNALIGRADSARPLFMRDVVFPLTPEPSAYERWLRTLSSST
jgi:DNA processing protein